MQVTEENGGFTVSVRKGFNDEDQSDNAQGHQLARSIEMASEMISDLATQFCIPQSCICLRFAMGELGRHATLRPPAGRRHRTNCAGAVVVTLRIHHSTTYRFHSR